MLEKCCGTAKNCKKLQTNRALESGLKRGQAGRMSFCEWQIGSAMHRLAPSKKSFAVDRRNCNEQSRSLFTMSIRVMTGAAREYVWKNVRSGERNRAGDTKIERQRAT
jgi:hypothetical protein